MSKVVELRERKVKLGKVIDVVENRIEHCKAQASRYNKEGDARSAQDWLTKEIELKTVWEQISELY